MDFKNWYAQKRSRIYEKINSDLTNKNKKQLTRCAVRSILLIYAAYILMSYIAYPAFLYYAIYEPFASDHIEAYLNKTSETILLESSNNTEIADNIVKWELNEFIHGSDIFSHFFDPFGYRIPKSAGWYIFLNRGNCGERAIIFNDMASRTGLKYRKMVVDGFIYSKYNSSSDHSWSEVLLEDGSWVIADTGFNSSPLYTNKSVFCSEKNMLLGPVFVYENITATIDCTEDYVDNTEKIRVKAVRDGKEIDNANIQITMNYNGISRKVAGGFARFIKFKTNESGISDITLGVYDNVSYTIKVVDSKGVYHYEGKRNIVLASNTGEFEVEVDKLRPNIAFLILGIISMPYMLLLRKIITRKVVKKEKHEKL